MVNNLSKISFFLAGLSLVSFAVVRFLLGTWVPFLWVALGLFVGFVAMGLWLERKLLGEFFSLKTTRQGMNMGTLILLVLIFLGVLNFFGARHYKTFDFSMGGVNSLSDQSVKLLKDLKSELQVIYFYKEGVEGVKQVRQGFIELMKKYQDESPQVKLQFVEVNQRPDLAEKYEVKQGTQVVFMEYQGRKAKIEKVDEQELTSALVKVMREKSKTVYFLSGHGESPITQSPDGSSISFLKKLLEESRYEVKEYSFNQGQSVPKGADMLFVVGPQRTFLDVEVRGLEDYLKSGGSLVLALPARSNHGLDGLLKRSGVHLVGNVVATVLQTPMGNLVDPRATRGSDFSSSHPITKPFGANDFVVFRLPSALEKVSSAPEGAGMTTVDEIVKTSRSSMSFGDLSLKSPTGQGPFTLAMAVKGSYKGTAVSLGAGGGAKSKGEVKVSEPTADFSLVVFGDATFLNDQYLPNSLNRDLALNTVAFLAKEENLISITPKEVSRTQMTVTPTQFTLFVFGVVIPLPVLLLIGSGVLWYRRRYS